jgi:hypothetical protein
MKTLSVEQFARLQNLLKTFNAKLHACPYTVQVQTYNEACRPTPFEDYQCVLTYDLEESPWQEGEWSFMYVAKFLTPSGELVSEDEFDAVEKEFLPDIASDVSYVSKATASMLNTQWTKTEEDIEDRVGTIDTFLVK